MLYGRLFADSGDGVTILVNILLQGIQHLSSLVGHLKVLVPGLNCALAMYECEVSLSIEFTTISIKS